MTPELDVYGTGTADLLQAIKDALLAEPLRGHPEAARDTIYHVLRRFSGNIGQNPDTEVVRTGQGWKGPGSDRAAEGSRTYYVAWESGPYDWAIPASFVVMDVTDHLAEPYHGFDLQLYDAD